MKKTTEAPHGASGVFGNSGFHPFTFTFVLKLVITPDDKFLEAKAAFFDEATDFFLLFDQDLQIVGGNKAARKFLDHLPNGGRGLPLKEFSPNVEKSGRYDSYLNVLKTGNPVVFEDVMSAPSEGYLRLSVKAFKVQEGLGMIITNITRLKETIDDLDTFIYKASHDMRSPVTTIAGLTALLKDEADPQMEKQYLDLMGVEVKKLDQIIAGLVQTAELRIRDLNIEEINLADFLGSIFKHLETLKNFENTEFKLDIPKSLKLKTDKKHLQTILGHLLSNAIKFADPEKDKHVVRIEAKKEVVGVRITISDNGVGIPEEVQQEIFRIFFRTRQEEPGTGLGLFLVKQSINKLDGYIQLKSKQGEGATFTLWFPEVQKNGEQQA